MRKMLLIVCGAFLFSLSFSLPTIHPEVAIGVETAMAKKKKDKKKKKGKTKKDDRRSKKQKVMDREISKLTPEQRRAMERRIIQNLEKRRAQESKPKKPPYKRCKLKGCKLKQGWHDPRHIQKMIP